MANKPWLLSILGGAALALLGSPAEPAPPVERETTTILRAAPGRAPTRPERTRTAFLKKPAKAAADRATAASVRLEPLDLTEVRRQDALDDAVPGTPTRIGINRPAGARPIRATEDGTWQTLPDGTKTWSIQLESPGAEALRVHFSELDLPAGTRIVVGGIEGAVDAYPAGSEFVAGGLWTPPAPGETLRVEFQQPPGAEDTPPTIVLDEVSHIYRDMRPTTPPAGRQADDGTVAAASGSCHEDVNCWPTSQAARDAVGRMIFTVPGEGTFVCSGALLNDADPNTFAGYFLTANHCVGSQVVADSVVIYWFYQTSSCNGSLPSLSTRPRSFGATLLATSHRSGGTDSTLLRLNDDPAQGQGFAAWSADVPGNGAIVHGIHHPGGSYKRYSQGFVTQNQPVCNSLPLSRFVYNDWTAGIIEGGSSGSPLFNSNWEVIGQLFGVCFFQGTNPGCDNPEDYNNLYGRFSVFYGAVSQFLNATAPDDPYEHNDAIGQAATLVPGSHDLVLVDFDDYFAIDVEAPGELTATASFDPASLDLQLRLLDGSGAVADASASGTGAAVVSSPVTAGTYFVHAERSSGWGDAYRLDVELVIDGCQPPPPGPDPEGVPKNRYLTIVPPDTTDRVAIRVRFDALQVPDPPNDPSAPPPDLIGLTGRSMWVGPPQEFAEFEFPLTTAFAAELQCEPHFMDWSGFDAIHIHAPEIVPSSSYSIQTLYETCSVDNPSNYSDPLEVHTARWGDVAEPFQAPSPAALDQPNVLDVAAAVDTLKRLPTALPRTRAQLQPASVNPATPVTVLELGQIADASRGLAYPFAAAPRCP